MTIGMTIEMQVEADVSVLMFRALFEKEIHVFGEDGLGKYGTCDRAKTFRISDIHVDVDVDEDSGDVKGIIYITLDGYDQVDCGHIMSDRNAEISIAKLLKDQIIDPSCLKWAGVHHQGDDFIAMFVDVPLLLDWA